MDTTKEKMEQEMVQDKLLMEYQQRKDLLALAKEQSARMKTIGFNREMASFNLEAAQRTKVSYHCKLPRSLCYLKFRVCAGSENG